jgi:hypothetical protein
MSGDTRQSLHLSWNETLWRQIPRADRSDQGDGAAVIKPEIHSQFTFGGLMFRSS